ncbi:MBL fold metallo-hydrolase [Marinigracilibium pacificum]|uniref:MBL fold metallo-hydrolase n=1 Tax=Marinigracilibium pacificum TaxID=2729599 RepID=A0A848ITI0_9BACT|nr:MBL fold metallo-hydrolase [Marinigracilibium pacificum]NMM47783.1 MBL fold metallo-hydrolase [Marinigracilibium pacificum]
MKLLKNIFKAVGLILILVTLGTTIFLYTSPQFGQIPEGKDLERIELSPNYLNGIFVNLIKTEVGSFKKMIKTLPDFFNGKNGEPKTKIPVKFGNSKAIATDTSTHITWYGHSAFLIEIEGKRILIDPMLGETAAPVSFGASRFPYQKPIPIEELTNIDAIIISHDHYDHLDYPTIEKLKKHTAHFFTALGVGSHLKSWGIPQEKITELDWWESIKYKELNLVSCPARHFSGRGITDRNKTQWASWIITGNNSNLYFSGDGGYGPHFKEIGEKYGPFDLAMMECGQYNKAWGQIHMMPEESVQAGIDVKGKILMPIHWGAFKLAVHEWTEPIVRFKAEAETQNVSIVHPYIGEQFTPGQDSPQKEWWNIE